ncbi:MAG TPA: elongation factor 4 [Myxococcales bacterium]|nr:elongation factor 4 [Myxococcales bacterium]HIN85068.1 elongation factor 4 [Myxococcales bacterium]
MTEKIRNFSIIAHIDHGKSTLADRLLFYTGAVSERDMKSQFLDQMDLERERGITIKSQTARIQYKHSDGETYTINLIDTPGHVDFTYEVSRALAACEGALLVVDAVQGVQAQTVANVYLAIENDLEIIPVINKIDLPSADVEEVITEIEDGIGIECDGALLVSAKAGTGIQETLEAIVDRIPPPSGNPDAPLRALLIDSWYDSYRGVVILVRVVDGSATKGQKIQLMSTDRQFEVQEVGYFTPHPEAAKALNCGDVGYLIAGIRDVAETTVGDTVTDAKNPAVDPLPGFEQVQQMVFSGIFPTESVDFEPLREALKRLSLNDASFTWEPETSTALGFGFRCGFLGLLHMEIVQERLEREYDLDLVTTAPTVIYRVFTKDGEELVISNPKQLPSTQDIEAIAEPIARVTVHCHTDHVGGVYKLCNERRGIQKEMKYLSPTRVMIVYELPLSEIIYDFYDKLKTVSRGYASMDYEVIDYRRDKLVRLDVLINGDLVDALTTIVHTDRSFSLGQALTRKLKEVIQRQMYEVAIQAAVGTRVIARTTVKAFRKNVTAKCYGGDISRKRKLLEKQKAGKKRMKQVGNVEIPQEAFHAVLQLDE